LSLDFGTYKNSDLTQMVDIQTNSTSYEFYVQLEVDFEATVEETRYFGLVDLFLKLGAFKSIFELFIAIVIGLFIYKSYSTYVCRQI